MTHSISSDSPKEPRGIPKKSPTTDTPLSFISDSISTDTEGDISLLSGRVSTSPPRLTIKTRPRPSLMISIPTVVSEPPSLKAKKVDVVRAGCPPRDVEKIAGAEEWCEESSYLLDLCDQNHQIEAQEKGYTLPEGDRWSDPVQYIFEKIEGKLVLVGKMAPTDLGGAKSGSSGSYFLSRLRIDDKKPVWEKTAVVKVAEEELGMRYAKDPEGIRSKKGIPKGQNCLREICAFDLCSDAIPPTYYCKANSTAFKGVPSVRRGDCSVQLFIPSLPKEKVDLASVDYRNIAMSDLLLWNSDRNSENILFDQDGHPHAIDQGCILPQNCASGGVFYWLQHIPDTLSFTPDQCAKIDEYDIEDQIDFVKSEYPEMGEGVINTMRVAATFVKKMARSHPIKEIAYFLMDLSPFTPNLGLSALRLAAIKDGKTITIDWGSTDVPPFSQPSLDTVSDELIDEIDYAKAQLKHISHPYAHFDILGQSPSTKAPIWMQAIQEAAHALANSNNAPPPMRERVDTLIDFTNKQVKILQAFKVNLEAEIAKHGIPEEEYGAVMIEALKHMPYEQASSYNDLIHYLSVQTPEEFTVCSKACYKSLPAIVAAHRSRESS